MDVRKYNTQQKFDVLENVDLSTNLLIVQEIVSKWHKSKPNNKELNLLKDAVIKVSLIANKLIYEKELYHLAISEYREDKIRAINRARRSESELNKLREKQITKIKNL